MTDDVLDLFHPAISRWFRESFAGPTPAQSEGWPRIAAGENTLILAPTGSGKTLAAFLYAIHELVSRPSDADTARGVHTLYVSPLKALANDIERNLAIPLAGVSAAAAAMGIEIPDVSVGLRTGDTPPSERQKMVRRPPEILITTPESLHLLLTSPRAREMLRTVEFVIVDEIHSLVSGKRGTFLALLLERLEELVSTSPVRVGLSATQRPLELVGQFLGGFAATGAPRPVAVVDAGMRKDLDIEVTVTADDMTALPRSDGIGPTIWPSVHARLLDEVEAHKSTLIFANNRRLVERIAAELDRLAGHGLVRAHHGSISREQRFEIECELKAGRLPALVATSSLELGIDVGAIDLVCQVEAPTSVASALQRVGRAGHLVRETSKGRLIPKTREDLLRMAGISRGMLKGEISAVRVPENPLDVLAQQIVAMVALDRWPVEDLFRRIRQAYPYRNLPREAFTSVVELVSGRYRSPGVSALRPRIAWDRGRDMLEALSGSRHAAILNGGTIPDSGQYAMVLEDGTTKLGELDEEFVFERRLGQTILLGTSRWRILEIGADRVTVAPSDETEAVMPFWKGEGLGHDAEFGRTLGAFIRECSARLTAKDFESWLAGECALDEAAARNLAAYLRSQRECGGVLPDDRTILLDGFRNEAGDPRMAVLSPFGRSFHLALLLALQGTLRMGGAQPPQSVFSNAGVLLRLGKASMEDLAVAFRSLRAEDVEERISAELEHTPYFAFRFRRNAARALLLPRARPGRRTPLWLQRLRAHDLLEYAKGHGAFPVIVETYREILEDLLPLESLRRFLRDVAAGEARFVVRRDLHPSPFAASLLLDFVAEHLYEKDEPAPSSRDKRFDRAGMVALLRERGSELALDPSALQTMDERLQGVAPFDRARDGVELVDLLQRIGDLTEDEIAARCEPRALAILPDLLADRRVVRVAVGDERDRHRLAAAEDEVRYERWAPDDERFVVRRFVSNHAAVTRAEILARYPDSSDAIDALVEAGDVVDVALEDGKRRLGDPEVVAGVRRLTLVKRRQRVRSVTREVFAASILRRQHVASAVSGEESLADVLAQLSGWTLSIEVWADVLAARVEGFRLDALDRLTREGRFAWRGTTALGGGRGIAFAPSDVQWILPDSAPGPPTNGMARIVLDYLIGRGASYAHQIARDLEMAPSAVASLLWDLIWEGRVTNDSLAPVFSGKPEAAHYHGRRKAPWGGGRWSSCPGGSEGRGEECVNGLLRVLLDRYGMLTRELVERDPIDVCWRDAYPVLSRMEWRGEADRGLFVDGLSGLQFAAPGALDTLCGVAMEREMLLIHASDPANVWGDVIPIERSDGERYTLRRHPGNYIVLDGGRPILAVENHGERLVPLDGLEAGRRREAVGLLAELVEGPTRRASIRVRSWDGRPVTATPVAEDLERIGFMREDPLLILYRKYEGDA